MKFEYTPDEVKQYLAIDIFLQDVSYKLYDEKADTIDMFAKDGIEYIRFEYERDSASFPLNLLYLDNIQAIKDYLNEQFRFKQEAEKLRVLEVTKQQEALKEQKEYETYLKLQEKYKDGGH